MQTQEVAFGRANQLVEAYFPECVRLALGIPSSVTAQVFFGTEANDGDVELTPSVTVDSVSTTINVASGQTNSTTRNRIGVASASGITAGVLYLLDNSLSQREVVEPKKINSTTIDLVHDLQYDYATTVSTLKGIRCYFTVDSTWVADEVNILLPVEPNYRVLWQYTVAGTVYSHQTYFRLVRKPFKSSLNYTEIVNRWPSLVDSQPRETRGDKFSRLIDGAEDTVRSDLIAEGFKPEQMNDTETIDRLVNLALDYQVARFHAAPQGRDRETFIAECQREYGQLIGKMITTLKVDIDNGVKGASSFEPLQPYFFKR